MNLKEGKQMYKWAIDLFPICRSIMGKGFRDTLNYLKKINPTMKILSYRTGYKAFDWIVPEEWVINDAWIKDNNGNKIIDFNKCNLHVMGYSSHINKVVSKDIIYY